MEGDPSGKGLRRLPQQVGGGASENEEAAVRPWLVHEDTQLREEVRTPLHLVYHDQAPQRLKCEHRVREQGQVPITKSERLPLKFQGTLRRGVVANACERLRAYGELVAEGRRRIRGAEACSLADGRTAHPATS